MNLTRIIDGMKPGIEIPVGQCVKILGHTAICRKADPALEPGDKCIKCEFSGGEIGGCESRISHVSFFCCHTERTDGKEVFFEKFVGSVE